MKILNIQSEYDVSELEKVQQRRLRSDMTEPPSEEELMCAIVMLTTST